MNLDGLATRIIHDLIVELCSELDLHYEDDQMTALQSSIQVTATAAGHLKQSGHAVPEVYDHLLRRYQRSGAQATHPVTEHMH